MLAKIGSKLVALVERTLSGSEPTPDGNSAATGGGKRLGAVSRALKARQPRSATKRVASVYFDDMRRRAVVHDISPGGAMIEMRLPPAVGEKVIIDISGMAPLSGEVRWRLENKVGIQFETPILNVEVMEYAAQSEDPRESL